MTEKHKGDDYAKNEMNVEEKQLKNKKSEKDKVF